MFILESRQQLERAINRAKAIKPRVSVKALGRYSVEGHAGNTYTVRCERRDGQKVVDCTCPAGQHGTPCYHSAAAVGLHICLAQASA
jgi:hypothetical protein